MKIAIDVSQIAYEGTGVASYTRDLVINLLRYDKSNRYLIFAYSFRKISLIENFFNLLRQDYENVSFKILPVPQTLANLLWNRLHYPLLEKFIGPVDIYHSSDWIQIPSSAKKITTVHDLIVYRYPQTSAAKILATQKKRLQHVKHECQMILADSSATKKDLIDILKIDPNKIEVVYPGVSDAFNPQKKLLIKKVLKKYNLKPPFILAVGKNEPRKNLEKVISAHQQLNLPIRLVIVSSEGWGREFKKEKNVNVLKSVGVAELPAIYSSASILIYPSLYEGFGLPIIEAMKCGCPVITSDRGSLKEVADAAALIVNPESDFEIARSCEKILKDEMLRKKLIRDGFENAKRFSWEKSARKLISIYNSL